MEKIKWGSGRIVREKIAKKIRGQREGQKRDGLGDS